MVFPDTEFLHTRVQNLSWLYLHSSLRVADENALIWYTVRKCYYPKTELFYFWVIEYLWYKWKGQPRGFRESPVAGFSIFSYFQKGCFLQPPSMQLSPYHTARFLPTAALSDYHSPAYMLFPLWFFQVILEHWLPAMQMGKWPIVRELLVPLLPIL